MRITRCTFIVAADVATIADVATAFETSDNQPEFVIVFPTRNNSDLGILPYGSLATAPPNLELLQHPYLQTRIGKVDQSASEEIRQQAVSDHGMAIVMKGNVPVELLKSQVLRDEIELQAGLSIPSLECPHCKKRSKPFLVLLKKGGYILYCSRCGEKWF